MKKVCIVTLLVAVSVFLSGYADIRKAEHIYFTIHYNNQKVVVSDSVLRPKWYNTQDYVDFTKGKTLYERAEQVQDFEKDFPEIFKILKKAEREVERKAFDGNIHFDPSSVQKFWVTDALAGVEMDIEEACSEILSALRNKRHADIIIKTREVPHKTEKNVLSKIGLRASYSTRFDAGNQSRSENIRRSIACFNGLRLMPGEEISFNKVVGPRTAERGYEEAKIIIDGEFVPGIGGGVCQASTTLFNAVLMSGLSIVESHNHSLPITYVPFGRDAMVSSAVDFVFCNNTGAPVYFKAGIEKGNRVFVEIYGNKLGNLKYKPITEVSQKEKEIEVVGSVPVDMNGFRKVCIEEGYPARSVLTYLEIYNGTRLVNKKLVRKSNYKGKKEVVRYERVPEPPKADIGDQYIGQVNDIMNISGQ